MTGAGVGVGAGAASAGAESLDRAAALCGERGVRLTSQRRRVLEILCAAGRPVGAYEIMDALRDGPRVVAPPTVYRALDFLLEQGLIHKLESLHAYVGCRHPDRPHLAGFMICLHCRGATEIDDSEVERRLEHLASGSGFAACRRVVELVGTCAGCSGGDLDRINRIEEDLQDFSDLGTYRTGSRVLPG